MTNEELLARLGLKIAMKQQEVELKRVKYNDNPHLNIYYGAIGTTMHEILTSISEVLKEAKE